MTKTELRKIIKVKRSLIENREVKDKAIFQSVINLEEYKKADTVLCYLSLDDEIKTDELVRYSLENKKRVAVPFCKDENGNMDFYFISSLEDTKEGTFGVREPNIKKCEKIKDFSSSIIIVPALCYNKNGYRLGYGKGYYDRFLENYTFISVGLCYNSLIADEIPVNEFDKPVDIIISENEIIRVNNGGKNG